MRRVLGAPMLVVFGWAVVGLLIARAGSGMTVPTICTPCTPTLLLIRVTVRLKLLPVTPENNAYSPLSAAPSSAGVAAV